MTYKAHNAAEYNGATKQNTHLPWKTVFRSMPIVFINLKRITPMDSASIIKDTHGAGVNNLTSIKDT